MFAVPDADEVRDTAAHLGFTISADEAALYTEAVAQNLALIDEFVMERLPESSPPAAFTQRSPGYRPSAAEDPLNAWMWKCHVEGAAEGLLAGRTVSLKDHIALAGSPLTFGSFVMEDFIPDFDATVVTRSLEAGATITGKNVMNGLTGGFGFGGGLGDYGRPKNPHNPAHVTGGSSSGSGAAVAAGEVDISFGGDQGGSIRIPAAWSGCYGLKPTFGLISHFGIGFGSDQSVDFTGPMARSVEDIAAALQAVAGHDGLDPRQGRAVPETVDVMSTLADGVSGLRIGILDEGFAGAQEGVSDLVHAAVAVLSDAGAKVETVSVAQHLTINRAARALQPEGSKAVFDTGFFGSFTKTHYPASLIAAVNRVWAEQPDLLLPRTKLNYLVGEISRRTYQGRVYAKAQNVRAGFAAAYDAAMAEVDVLVMPTCLLTAPEFEAPVNRLESVAESLLHANTNPAVVNTQPFNYTGHPALAVPVGKSGGLPVSMQIVGKAMDEATILRTAYAFQHSVDFASMIAVE